MNTITTEIQSDRCICTNKQRQEIHRHVTLTGWWLVGPSSSKAPDPACLEPGPLVLLVQLQSSEAAPGLGERAIRRPHLDRPGLSQSTGRGGSAGLPGPQRGGAYGMCARPRPLPAPPSPRPLAAEPGGVAELGLGAPAVAARASLCLPPVAASPAAGLVGLR